MDILTAAKTKLAHNFPALTHPNFRYFWFGQCLSLLGTWMFQLTQKAQKLTELPDRKLLCIMTMIEEKGKDASVLMCN